MRVVVLISSAAALVALTVFLAGISVIVASVVGGIGFAAILAWLALT